MRTNIEVSAQPKFDIDETVAAKLRRISAATVDRPSGYFELNTVHLRQKCNRIQYLQKLQKLITMKFRICQKLLNNEDFTTRSKDLKSITLLQRTG